MMDQAGESTRHILGRLHHKDFLSIYPHSSAPSHNLHRNAFSEDMVTGVDFFSQLSRETLYEITHPLPVTRPSFITQQEINGSDAGLQLVKEKNAWVKKKKDLLQYCFKKQADNIDESKLNSSKAFPVPLSVVRLADHFGKDPDEHFNNNYNVYYTGGNLSSMRIGTKKHFVYPKKHDDKYFIFLDEIPACSPAFDLDNFSTAIKSYIGCDSAIFQTEVIENRIISRAKNKIYVFLVSELENEDVSIEMKLVEVSDDPFFSVASWDSFLCYTSANKKLGVLDIEARKNILDGCIESDDKKHYSDTWSSINVFDKNTLCFADRNCIGFIDLRMKTTLAVKWPISEVTEICEEIHCSARGSKELEYIGTSHHLLALDLRGGFLQKWSHGLTHSPCYISIPERDTGYDRIFIGSQANDSVVFVENNIFVGTTLSTSHPYLLPNLGDTYHMARYHGSCLGNIVSSRFRSSLTGLLSLKDDEALDLFRLTCAGDIFGQSLKKGPQKRDIDLTMEDIETLDKWEEKCEELFQEGNRYCVAAEVLDDKHIIDYLNSAEEYTESREKLDYSQVPWGISKAELSSFCDYLAPRLLKEWDIEDMKEWAPKRTVGSEQELASSDEEEEDMTEKVAKWLEKNQEKEDEEDEDVYCISEPSSGDEEVIEMDPDLAEEVDLHPSKEKSEVLRPLQSNRPFNTTTVKHNKAAGF